MLGAIVGDTLGSIYEWNNIKTKEFDLLAPTCFFTDDSVLTVALADAILTGREYAHLMRAYRDDYPDAGYGGGFERWATARHPQPYNSWGNGAAMRISPAGYAYDSLEKTLAAAERFTAVTHNHPEGLKGGLSVAGAVFLARHGHSKQQIKAWVVREFGYDLDQRLDDIRPHYNFDESSQGTVPQAFVALLEAVDFEDAIRNAISLGGDSDTLACITGALAEAHFGGVPEPIAQHVLARLSRPLRQVTERFTQTYPVRPA